MGKAGIPTFATLCLLLVVTLAACAGTNSGEPRTLVDMIRDAIPESEKPETVTDGARGGPATGMRRLPPRETPEELEPDAEKALARAMSLYNIQLKKRINVHWARPELVVNGGRDFETVIAVVIGRDGAIRNKWFERQSGNRDFDDSAMRAVGESAPMPPLPEAWDKETYRIGLMFRNPESPKGR
ncbi:MAG: energy transducer TonB [Desulfatibacillaceae bacterium]